MQKPVRQLGLVTLLALIFGTVVGSGVFINISTVQNAAGSPYMAVMAWLIGGLIWIPQLFILAELGTAYPDQGFGYLYLKEAGYPGLSFLYVWTVFLTSDTPSITILALAAFQALDIFFPVLSAGPAPRIAAALLILAMTFIHIRSVKQGGRVQTALTFLKLLPLFLLIFAALKFLPGNFLPAASSPVSAGPQGPWLLLLLGGISATVWSYSGFPNILYMAGEVKKPESLLPKALLISGIVVTIIYSGVALSSATLIPHDVLIKQEGFVNPFAFMTWSKSFAAPFLAIAAFISMVGAANACLMVQPRIEYAIARDGLFFKSFGRLHPRFGTPHFSIAVQAAFAAFLLLFNIEDLLAYFTLSYILQNLLVYVIIFKLRKQEGYKPLFKSPAGFSMAVLSVLFQAALLVGSFVAYPVGGLLATTVLILSGMPVYVYFRKHMQNDIA